MRATSLGHAGILVETHAGAIVCDPWFEPAFFGSWFVFPRNDHLQPDLLSRIEHADFLYISHPHADHLDEPWLRTHLRRDITVLLPGFPTGELERTLRALGFTTFVRTEAGVPLELRPGLSATIFTETSISDGPGGDSAIVIDDGSARLLDQNDCRPHDPSVFTADGPIDIQWLQYSGAIWYPMVYEEPESRLRQLSATKVEAQFARAIQYILDVKATVVVPSAGPPCFLDPDLQRFNMITGDELSIFPDQTVLLARLDSLGVGTGQLNVPGTEFDLADGRVKVRHPGSLDEISRPFADKANYLAEYAADWAPWLEEHRRSWAEPQADLVGRLANWWEPLLAIAPHVRVGVGSNVLLRAGDESIVIDFRAGRVRPFRGEPYRYRFEIDRRLVETVVARRAIDWSNALFLSCRFTAWRDGPFNENVYNFFKSLSVERMERTEREAAARTASSSATVATTSFGPWEVERFCPHRQADLVRFGELEGTVLTCTLHGWQFDLAEDGRCLNSDGRHLGVRRRIP